MALTVNISCSFHFLEKAIWEMRFKRPAGLGQRSGRREGTSTSLPTSWMDDVRILMSLVRRVPGSVGLKLGSDSLLQNTKKRSGSHFSPPLFPGPKKLLFVSLFKEDA